MPLRIALTHAFSWPEVRRGGERYLHELAGALARRGHHVTILTGARRPSVGNEDGVLVVRLPRGPAERTMRAERIFGAEAVAPLAAGMFDVVHSLGARDAVASLRAASIHPKRRTVYTCLGLPLRSSWDRRPDGEAHARVVRDIDVYGCLSAFAQKCLHDDYGRAGALTPGGVRLDRFTSKAARADRPTLLYSGALDEPRKGVADLLQAVAILAQSEPDVQLWLSGSGDPQPLLDAAPAAARERTQVLPLGTPDDQPDRYSAAWATVLPSRFEAFGLVLIESLACGTPVVACDHAGPPELVSPGVGTVAPLDDHAALAHACGEALALARDPSIRDACRDAAREHDWDEGVAPRIERLYLGDERDA